MSLTYTHQYERAPLDICGTLQCPRPKAPAVSPLHPTDPATQFPPNPQTVSTALGQELLHCKVLLSKREKPVHCKHDSGHRSHTRTHALIQDHASPIAEAQKRGLCKETAGIYGHVGGSVGCAHRVRSLRYRKGHMGRAGGRAPQGRRALWTQTLSQPSRGWHCHTLVPGQRLGQAPTEARPELPLPSRLYSGRKSPGRLLGP